MKLQGQVAIIVGGGQGLGKAIAELFCVEGANIVLTDVALMKDKLDESCQELRKIKIGKILGLVIDATDEEQVHSMTDETLRTFGRIDILVNCAGFRGPFVPVQEISLEDWNKVVAVNLTAPFLCCKSVLKSMIKQRSGKIVNITGVITKKPIANRAALIASKIAVHGLTQSIAVEGGPYGVRANSISPGGVFDDRLKGRIAETAKNWGVSFEEANKRLIEGYLGKWATPEEVAKAALFLASDDSSHTTGEHLNVSGGYVTS
jgi:NAD(P)-dependent dehydrogenase (short-subunit alcohol dehydrogenase family)